MFDAILASEIRGRPVIEIPHPKPVLDEKGKIVLHDGRPRFNVAADRMDYLIAKQSPVRIAFSERFIIDPEHRATTTTASGLFLPRKHHTMVGRASPCGRRRNTVTHQRGTVPSSYHHIWEPEHHQNGERNR